jgi:hypothetical protein
MSGLPIDIVDTGAGSFYGMSGASAALARPNLASGVSTKGGNGYWFNPYAFLRPMIAAGQPIPSSGGSVIAGAAGTDFGNIGRNLLRGPSQSNVDIGAGKQFRITEAKALEFRAEFFNLLNHLNLANPISDLNAVPGSGGSIDPVTGVVLKPGSFGTIISATTNPRLVQFALKFRW